MYAVIRQYSGEGAKQLMDELTPMTSDVERIIRGVPGFISYTLIRFDDGGASVGIFQDKNGADESSRQAAAFIGERVSPSARVAANRAEGTVLLHLDSH
jgi:hypothetical protein